MQTLSAYPTNFQTVTENQNTNTENLQVRLVGYDDLKLDGAFAESEIRIVKGKYPKEKNEVVINQILAETKQVRDWRYGYFRNRWREENGWSDIRILFVWFGKKSVERNGICLSD